MWVTFQKTIDTMVIIHDNRWSLPNQKLDVSDFCFSFQDLSFFPIVAHESEFGSFVGGLQYIIVFK